MFHSREADAISIIVLFVILPLVTYILLGKWNEASNKAARVSILAKRVAEETFSLEEMACADVVPPSLPPLRYEPPSLRGEPSSLRSGIYSVKPGLYQCATCQSPATTRCSRCKSVRYCSGRCQIIHWRQGHKQTCQQWLGDGLSAFTGSTSPEGEHMPNLNYLNSSLLGSDNEDPLCSTSFGTLSGNSRNIQAEHLISDCATFSNKRPTDKNNFMRNDELLRASLDNGYNINSSMLAPENLSNDSSLNDKLFNSDVASPNSGNNVATTEGSTSSFHHPSKWVDEARKWSLPPLSPSITLYESEYSSLCSTGMHNSSEEDSARQREMPNLNLSREGSSINGISMYSPSEMSRTSMTHQTRADHQFRENVLKGVHFDGGEKKPERKRMKTINSNGCHLDGERISKPVELKIDTLKKPVTFFKRSLVGLINDNKRSKALQVLFPYEELVKFFLYDVRGISPRGLLNCGNSCYANAVLQCLTCTKPLVVYLLQRLHSNNCSSKNWCLMCELEHHASLLRESGEPLSLNNILSNMRSIGLRIGGGSQEDAHEFLRLLVMSMQAACLDGLGGEKSVQSRLQETTVVQQLFGGRLRSKVKCLRCHHESERYENIMDLTLEIHGWVESLQDALTQFTSLEDLDGENMYRCGRCGTYVKAQKQLMVHEVPNILTIVLKRFQTGSYGKINKRVSFPDMLDMIPFVTETGDSPPLYMLYGVVVHLDRENASFTGHYISYVRDMQGTWLRIDDSEVKAVPPSQVMSEGAYMLFYSRSFPRPPRMYIEKIRLLSPNSAKHEAAKGGHQSPIYEQERKENALDILEGTVRGLYDFTVTSCQDGDFQPRQYSHVHEAYAAEHISPDFSDAASNDWSLFTSSDESSFTTESTRDSFSIAGDSPSFDSLASLFDPFYGLHPQRSSSVAS